MGRAARAGHRLAAGTGRLLYGLGDVLDSPTGWGALGRIVGVGGGALFVGALIVRAPVLVYAVPLVWVAAAWRLSDSSATPPPRGAGLSGDVLAVERAEVARVVPIAEGVGCILHPVREEHPQP
ncbi:hypothetical protein ABZ070_10230 [Streptomyces sp. NPDC006283]|uniref:hypothetical protein n=1 Tax=Streptomyces sp. NPDC006283 TaxID=3156741 RepID=UPI00339F1394